MLFKKILFVCLLTEGLASVIGLGENTICTPERLVLLSNCSFIDRFSNQTINQRTLSMTVPYSLDDSEEHNLSIQLLTRDHWQKSLVRFPLNTIQCASNVFFNWTSVESSSTLRGEFVRTTFLESNIMYLPTALTYLRNLTAIDCSTKTTYRTINEEIFQINLQMESTLNDYCSNDSSCSPADVYQCDLQRQRCSCRSSFQAYLTSSQHLVCLRAVQKLEQCSIRDVRCLEWCQRNSSSNMCVCSKDVSTKKYSDDNRAYCEGRTNGICNSLIQCPTGNVCLYGICQDTTSQFHQFLSLDTVTISIITSSLILGVIIIILAFSVCVLRRQRGKKQSRSFTDSACKKKEQMIDPPTSDYDNIVYGVFRNNVQPLSSSTGLFPSNDDNVNDTSPFRTSDPSSYHPKIVFLGGEQQLTAIYA